MKQKNKVLKQVMIGIVCMILMQCPVFLMPVYGAGSLEGLYSAGAVLMDGDSGRILYSKNMDVTYAMASTTKIMTCILALEYADEEQIVTFSKNAASQPDVQMNAAEGEQYYLRDLLYSVMLESHNDSSVAVAEAVCGSVEAFVRLMDQKAEAIGCVNTNFVTPNGLDGTDEEGEHCTTAKDLAMIMYYCTAISSKADEFTEIAGTPSCRFEELNGRRTVYCSNHNALLETYPGAFAGKTGYTGKAGYCYVGAASREDETMIIALLGAGGYPHRSYKWKDAKRLLDHGFDNYSYVEIGKDQWNLEPIPVTDGMKKEVFADTDAGTFSFLLGKDETVRCRIETAKEVQAPVEKNAVVGTIFYELNGSVIEQFSVYAGESVEKSTFWNVIKKWFREIQDLV